MNRPALVELLSDIASGAIDIIVVYKVDRLSRSLADFSKMVDTFDKHGVSFVSITQQFNTSTSMGRLTLNVLLSFAQFEREVTGERIRDKIAASKKKGIWMGGNLPLGYDAIDRLLVANLTEAELVRHVYRRYLELESVKLLKEELDDKGVCSKPSKRYPSGRPFSRGGLYTLLKNPVYIGKIRHKEKTYPGEHAAVVDFDIWQQVQSTLAKNRHHQYLRTQAKAPSLLTGLIFDLHGNQFSPTHTRKKSRRYRYYVNQAKVQFKQTHPDTLLTVPASTIENAVDTEIVALWNDSNRLLDILASHRLSCPEQQLLTRQAQSFTEKWCHLTSAEKIEIYGQIITKIILARSGITLYFSFSGLLYVLLPQKPLQALEPDFLYDYKLQIPIQLKRCGVETKLIVKKPGHQNSLSSHSDSSRALQKAVIKAILWNEELLSGRAHQMQEIAYKNGIGQRYIAQIIKLANLSPELIQRVFDGNIPHDLTLGKLKAEMSLKWEDQAKLFASSY